MAKFCSNGHQIEDSWDVCPYCQRTGLQGLRKSTGGAAKTRLEAEPAPAGSAPLARKTVLIADKRRPPVLGWLVAMSGDQKGQDYRIVDGQNVIGSAPDADIQLNDVTISGRHASLRCKDGKFVLTDLDSTNGTFLNDCNDRISREELLDNDMLRLGEVLFKFKCL